MRMLRLLALAVRGALWMRLGPLTERLLQSHTAMLRLDEANQKYATARRECNKLPPERLLDRRYQRAVAVIKAHRKSPLGQLAGCGDIDCLSHERPLREGQCAHCSAWEELYRAGALLEEKRRLAWIARTAQAALDRLTEELGLT